MPPLTQLESFSPYRTSILSPARDSLPDDAIQTELGLGAFTTHYGTVGLCASPSPSSVPPPAYAPPLRRPPRSSLESTKFCCPMRLLRRQASQVHHQHPPLIFLGVRQVPPPCAPPPLTRKSSSPSPPSSLSGRVDISVLRAWLLCPAIFQVRKSSLLACQFLLICCQFC
jgi:hypothetical protein